MLRRWMALKATSDVRLIMSRYCWCCPRRCWNLKARGKKCPGTRGVSLLLASAHTQPGVSCKHRLRLHPHSAMLSFAQLLFDSRPHSLAAVCLFCHHYQVRSDGHTGCVVGAHAQRTGA